MFKFLSLIFITAFAAAEPLIVAEEVVVEERNLRVTVGPTIEILQPTPSRCAYSSAIRLANGDIIVSLPWPRDGREPAAKISKDSGLSWSNALAKLSFDGGLSWQQNQRSPILERFCQMSDGSIVGFVFPDSITPRIWNFNSNGTEGIRYPVSFTGMSTNFFPEHSIVQLPNGSLLASFMDCTTAKISVVTAVSTNKGRNWTYRATVAIDEDLVTQEGYVEPRLQVAENGDVLCFIRTGNSHTALPGTKNLVLTRSSDNGLTWQTPVKLADYGVYPNSTRLSDGTIVVCYGRPGNWLAFSRDNGQSWICKLNVINTVAPDCSSYNSIIEVSPGLLLMVYGNHSVITDYNTQILGMYIFIEDVNRSINDNLVGYVKFDQTFTNGVTVKNEIGEAGIYTTDDGDGSADGIFNGAVYFAGKAGDIINMGTSEGYDPGESSFSISVWFNLGSTTTYQSLVRKGARNSTMVGYGLATTSSGSVRSIHYRLNGSTTNRIDKLVSWQADIGNWHHLCLVVDRGQSTAYLYLDGELFDSSDISLVGGILPAGEPLTLGALQNSTAIAFGMEGALDEFAYWNRVLEAGEVGMLYNNGAGMELMKGLMADLNNDGLVDGLDLVIFAEQWLSDGIQ